MDEDQIGRFQIAVGESGPVQSGRAIDQLPENRQSFGPAHAVLFQTRFQCIGFIPALRRQTVVRRFGDFVTAVTGFAGKKNIQQGRMRHRQFPVDPDRPFTGFKAGISARPAADEFHRPRDVIGIVADPDFATAAAAAEKPHGKSRYVRWGRGIGSGAGSHHSAKVARTARNFIRLRRSME